MEAKFYRIKFAPKKEKLSLDFCSLDLLSLKLSRGKCISLIYLGDKKFQLNKPFLRVPVIVKCLKALSLKFLRRGPLSNFKKDVKRSDFFPYENSMSRKM